jgi:hypothetical protein
MDPDVLKKELKERYERVCEHIRIVHEISSDLIFCNLNHEEVQELSRSITTLLVALERCKNEIAKLVEEGGEKYILDPDGLLKYLEHSKEILPVVKTYTGPFLFVRAIRARESILIRILHGLGLHPGEYVVKLEDAQKAVEIAVLKTIEILQEEKESDYTSNW